MKGMRPVLALLALLLTACGAGPLSTPRQEPTPIPAATPTSEPTITPTAPPTSTPTRTPTKLPTPTPPLTSTPTETPAPTTPPTRTPLPTLAAPTAVPTADPCAGITDLGAREKFGVDRSGFERALPCLNSPNVVSAFANANIIYQSENLNEYIPAWMVWERGYDDCDGFAIFQCAVLEANGWDAFMIGLSVEGTIGHNVYGVMVADGRIMVLDNGYIPGTFGSLAEIATYYIDRGAMQSGGTLRTIRASQITQVTTDVFSLPWVEHGY